MLEGLVKVVTTDANGGETTIAGIQSGGWFGEGSVLKNEPFRYEARALRRTQVALLPASVFHELLDSSIMFNRFLLSQLNERLSQFIAARETERMGPDVRVARHLAALCQGIQPRAGALCIRVRQQELADLAGLSRQRVNQALARLGAIGLLRVEYGTVHVLQRDSLSEFRGPWHGRRNHPQGSEARER